MTEKEALERAKMKNRKFLIVTVLFIIFSVGLLFLGVVYNILGLYPFIDLFAYIFGSICTLYPIYVVFYLICKILRLPV